MMKKNNPVVWTAACCVEPMCLLFGKDWAQFNSLTEKWD